MQELQIQELTMPASLKGSVSPEEWRTRVDLAALYRLLAYYRWTDGILNHISLRIPGEESFLINPFGLLYEEITASSLVKVDVDGGIIHDPIGWGINNAGFLIHSAVHKARPDVHCVIHTHTRAGCAVAAQAEGLLPISQSATVIGGQIAYHDYEGVVLHHDEQVRLVAALGDKPILILRNHGLLTTGKNTADAFNRMKVLERACEIQVAAQGSGATLTRVSDEALRQTRIAVDRKQRNLVPEWSAMIRLVERIAPDFRN